MVEFLKQGEPEGRLIRLPPHGHELGRVYGLWVGHLSSGMEAVMKARYLAILVTLACLVMLGGSTSAATASTECIECTSDDCGGTGYGCSCMVSYGMTCTPHGLGISFLDKACSVNGDE